MTHPWGLERLSQDRAEQLRHQVCHPGTVPRHRPTVRSKVGWSLISLGANLALDRPLLTRPTAARELGRTPASGVWPQ